MSKKHKLIGTGDNGKIEFHLVGEEVYRVNAGWIKDVNGLPMGMRWECGHTSWLRYRNTCYDWVKECDE